MDLVKQDHSITSFQDMKEAAAMMAKSKLFPQWDTAEKMLTLMLLCKSEGSDPVQAVQRYDCIQGRVSKKPQAMLADFIGAGGKVQWEECSNSVARAKFTPPGMDSHIEEFTIEDARQAQLASKDNWKKYPKAMLKARCISAAMRAVYPNATSMMYTPEEVESTPQDREPVNMFDTEARVAPEGYTELKTVPVNIHVEADDGTEQGSPWDELKSITGAAEYLKSINWLEAHLPIDDLPFDKIARIELKPDKFREQVEQFVSKQGGDA